MTFETRTILQVDPHWGMFSHPGTLSMEKLTLNRPSLQSPICNLPDFGRHVTSPNQGLPSLASWGVKRRDPGNEVATRLVGHNHLISNKREWNNCVIENNQEMLLDHADFALQEQAEDNLMVAFS